MWTMDWCWEGSTKATKGLRYTTRAFDRSKAPVPFLLMRHAVISDWKFFLDSEDWLNLWARRYGESAVQALAEELRRLPWRAGRASSKEEYRGSSGRSNCHLCQAVRPG